MDVCFCIILFIAYLQTILNKSIHQISYVAG